VTRRVLRVRARADLLGGTPSRKPLEFHRRLPGYTPTPLVDADTLAAELGLGALWVKNESSRLGLPSFKILGASWGVWRALQEHLGDFETWSSVDDLRAQLQGYLPLALAAATDGNHGRAVARMAALLGLKVRIFVPRGTARSRIDGIESEGASCEIVDGGYDDAVARSAEEASASCIVISDTSWEGYEQVPRWVIEGYSTIFYEIDEQLGDARPGVVFIQMGVGALGAAAARHFRSGPVESQPRLVGVEPSSAACVLAAVESGHVTTIPGPQDSIMAGLNCGTASPIAWPWVSRGFDAYLAIDDHRAEEGMRALARNDVVAGETGAAGLGGLLELLDSGPRREFGLTGDAKVLVICTEGATDPGAFERIVGRPA
jgi:diaminopropionate ammonia-lyase